MNRPSKTPDPASLRNRALGYLARREHSRAGLTRKLEAAGYDVDAIKPLLDQFEEKGWLSDRRFAESWVADHREKHGPVKLAHALREHGVSDDLIAQCLPLDRDASLSSARALYHRKFSAPPTDAREHAKRVRFLLGRGYDMSTVYAVIRDPASE